MYCLRVCRDTCPTTFTRLLVENSTYLWPGCMMGRILLCRNSLRGKIYCRYVGVVYGFENRNRSRLGVVAHPHPTVVCMLLAQKCVHFSIYCLNNDTWKCDKTYCTLNWPDTEVNSHCFLFTNRICRNIMWTTWLCNTTGLFNAGWQLTWWMALFSSESRLLHDGLVFVYNALSKDQKRPRTDVFLQKISSALNTLC